MMRRGCSVTFVHFHSYPILSRASQDKARQLVTLLTQWQQRSRLYLVPFGDIQQQVVLAVPAPMRVVVYRRLMMRIAEQIARARGAQALVTGEVVGQVASQTLENLAVIGNVAALPIFRPLIGTDKEEITAKRRGSGAILFPSFPIRTAARCSHHGTRKRARVWRRSSPPKRFFRYRNWSSRLFARPSWRISGSPAPSRAPARRVAALRAKAAGGSIRGCPVLEDPEVCTWL